jgi:hypothetical protein
MLDATYRKKLLAYASRYNESRPQSADHQMRSPGVDLWVLGGVNCSRVVGMHSRGKILANPTASGSPAIHCPGHDAVTGLVHQGSPVRSETEPRFLPQVLNVAGSLLLQGRLWKPSDGVRSFLWGSCLAPPVMSLVSRPRDAGLHWPESVPWFGYMWFR